MHLRPYQTKAIEEVRTRFRSGKRAPLIVSPTGSGKTVIMSEMIRLHLQQNTSNKVLVVAHRRELIGQLSSTLVKLGVLDIGEIFPGAPYRHNARVQVASTQTLLARDKYPNVSMCVYDECHHYVSDMWSQLTSVYDKGIRIGFTATPMRSDGKGLGNAFDSLVVVSTIRELTAQGFLVPCRVIAPEIPLKRPELACRPVEAYQQHAIGKRTVVFAEFIKDAEQFRDEFIEAGYKAHVIHGGLSDSERRGALLAHERGDVLINCMVLTEGWDSKPTSVCILARGCGSIITYIQIVGRILRPCEGKTEALLIDLRGSAFHTHGPPEEDKIYSLEGKAIRRKDSDTLKFCATCGHTYESPPCSFCGKETSSWEEPKYIGVPLAERYAAKRAEDIPKRIESLSRWMSEARYRGKKVWSAVGKYKGVYGVPPTNEILSGAMSLSRSMKCSSCSKCKKQVAVTYKSGMCGKCSFS